MSAECKPLLQLEPDQIDLWVLFEDDRVDEHRIEWCRRVLTAEEQERALSFYFERDRRNYRFTRAMIRTVLSRYSNLAPESWSFATNRYGKPHVVNEAGVSAYISFNISNTPGLVVIAVTLARAVGVDCEGTAYRPDLLGIADRYFAPSEVAALNALPPSAQMDRFFHYWTLKESYIKARGMGLSIPLHQFAFQIGHSDGVDLTIDPSQNDQAQRWHFWQLQPSPDFVVAVCAERSAQPPSRLSIRRIQHPSVDSAVSYPLLRSSLPSNTG